MKKFISYWSMKDGLANTHPIADALAEAKAAGFDGLELGIAPEGALTVDTTQAECEEIRALIDASGLTVQTLASGMSWGFNPVSNDASVRERAVSLHEAALQRAAWLGCDAMLFVPGVVNSPIAPDEHVRPDHAVERCRANVDRLLKTAERVGVDLCLENVWNGLFYSAAELAAFIDSFGTERLGVYLDVGNLMGVHQWPPHWIEMLGRRIKRVHVKDFKHDFNWQGSYDFCRLGEGDVPWEPTLAALRSIGYDGTVVAEMLPHSPGLVEHTSETLGRILGAAAV